ncbi:MAG TPA: tetratricopeptide repeat protein [Micropepsaceae bacterium]|nr:tetratricopeptide repeat protein [Micropepsaceae bacterium]
MKLRKVLTLASSFAALSLGACSTTMMTASDRARPSPQASASVAGTYLAANFAAAQGDVKAATSFYANSLKDDPANTDLLERTFLFAAEAGEIDQAIGLTDRVLMQDASNRPAHLVLEVGALAKKDYAAVIKDVGSPSQGLFAALTNRVIEAWARAGMRDFDGALNALDSLTMQRGVDGLRLIHRALILDYAGRDKDADEAYRQAITVMGTGPRAADAYGRFLLRHNRGEEAKTLYERALKENPGNPVAERAQRDISAKKTPAPLISSPADGVAEALFGIAASLNDQRSADVAILYLNLTLYLRPDFDLARVLIASRYEAMAKYDLANGIYARIQPTSPYYAMTQVQAAINDGRQGQIKAGIAKMKALAANVPQEADVWTALGDLLRSADQYTEAATAYDKAIAGTPDGDRRLIGLYYARGVSLERSNKWDAAERDFRAALKLNPDRADVLNYLGYSWVDKGEHLDEAVAMLEKARALRPLDGFIADSVGWAYYRLGRYQDATRALEEAVQLAPGAPDVNDHLGDAYWRVGRKIDARFQWQHALQLNPDAKQKPLIERKLQFGLDSVSASGS